MPNSNVWQLVAGGANGEYGDVDGVGSAARFNHPLSCDVNTDGTLLFVADYGNGKVKQVDLVSGEVTTIGSEPGYRPIKVTFVRPHNRLVVFWQDTFNKNTQCSFVNEWNGQYWSNVMVFPERPLYPVNLTWGAGTVGYPSGLGFFKEVWSTFYSPGAITVASAPNDCTGCDHPGPEATVLSPHHIHHVFAHWVHNGLHVPGSPHYWVHMHSNSSTNHVCSGYHPSDPITQSIGAKCKRCVNPPLDPPHNIIIADIPTSVGTGSVDIAWQSNGDVDEFTLGRMSNDGKVVGIKAFDVNLELVTLIDVVSPVHGLAWSEYLQSWVGVTKNGNWDEVSPNQSGSTNGTGWNQVVRVGGGWYAGMAPMVDTGAPWW